MYVLTDKQILAPESSEYPIPRKEFTDIVKLKKKEGQNGNASVLLIKENKTLMRGNARSNRGAGIEEKIIQKLLHLGINHICSHQIQAL